jgi:1,4-dihydroxy-2-naphthoate octaprenyltransferase
MIDSAFRPDAFVAALIGALAIQVAANFVNDISDAHKGADTEDRIGPTRVVAGGLLSAVTVTRGAWAAFTVAILAGLWLTAIAGWVVIAIGLISIVATLGYVSGPRPYGYIGLGEVFVFTFFGMVATVGSRYVHDRTAPLDAWLLAIPIGLLAAGILVVNNIRDIETDEAAGKRTLAVILGRERTAKLFGIVLVETFLLIGLFAVAGWTPPATAAALLAAPLAFPLWRLVSEEIAGPPLIKALKGTARLHLLVGVLLAVGAALR